MPTHTHGIFYAEISLAKGIIFRKISLANSAILKLWAAHPCPKLSREPPPVGQSSSSEPSFFCMNFSIGSLTKLQAADK